MTLLIACLLIWAFRLAWWWYALAVVVWLVRVRWYAILARGKRD